MFRTSRCRGIRRDYSDVTEHEIIRHLRDLSVVTIGPAIFYRDVFTDFIARFRKSANEGLDVCGISGCRGPIEEADCRSLVF